MMSALGFRLPFCRNRTAQFLVQHFRATRGLAKREKPFAWGGLHRRVGFFKHVPDPFLILFRLYTKGP